MIYRPVNNADRATTKKILLNCSSCIVFDRRKDPTMIVVTATTEIKFGRNGSASRVMLFFFMIYLRNAGMAIALKMIVSNRIKIRLTTLISVSSISETPKRTNP
jgi:hypothetical protein